MRGRPRNNESRTLQGVKEKTKQSKTHTPKAEIESAKDALVQEVFKTVDPGLQAAFEKYGAGCDAGFLMSIVGMELMRLQRSIEPGESPDYRYTSAVNKYLDQLRRLVTLREGADSFIPDSISVQLESISGGKDGPDEDQSDDVEFA